MYILLACPTMTDNITFPDKTPQLAKVQKVANRGRTVLRAYSNMDFLLKKVQEGQVIMSLKVEFDNYLQSQVDTMRACVFAGVPCPFTYNGFMNSDATITTSGLGVKQQWAIQMVMSRYNLSSIYHAAAYSSLEYLFTETAQSFQKVKEAPKFINHLQIAFKYFNEGYQPLKRLAEAYPALQQLLGSNPPIQCKKQVFFTIRDLISINLAYLKLEKYRIMGDYRLCKEGAFAVYQAIRDIVRRLKSNDLLGVVSNDIRVFLTVGSLFFQAYAYHALLLEHEDLKNKEQYGFIKKQFQQMIIENNVVCEQFIQIAKKIDNFPDKQSLDNVIFANSIVQKMLVDVKKKQYAYSISVHENKEIRKPSMEEITAQRIAPRDIATMIGQF